MNTGGEAKRIRAWLREQGEEVADRGAIGSDRRARYYAAHPGEAPAGWVEPIPGPDADDAEFEDLGEMSPGPVAADGPESDTETVRGPRRYTAVPGGGEGLSDDSGPAHASREFRKRARGGGKRPAPGRVTPAIQRDINAKIEFALMIPGTIWQARDSLCGGTFVQQTPEIAEAFTEIVIDSPDLVAFFTGPGGTFMKILKLGAACMPVAQVVTAHHVYHSIEPQPDMTQPD